MGTLRLRRVLTHLLSLFLLLRLVAAAIPGITRTQFDSPISEVSYFDDSDVVLVTDEILESHSRVWRSTDAGATWKSIEELGEGRVAAIIMNPHDKKVAIALSATKNQHWVTRNRGEDWHSFELPDEAIPSFRSAQLVSFHADDSDRIILNTRTPRKAQAVYTTNGFDDIKILREDTLRCLWAREQPQFSTGSDDADRVRTLCVAGGRYSQTPEAQRLLMSDNFFKTVEEEPELDSGRAVQGIVSVVAARGFVLAARQTAGTSEMALYVTTDTKKWHRASFGDHQLKEGGYTIMDSTNYSLQVDVRTNSLDMPAMGALFTSNSEGYNFVQNGGATNRNQEGFVDFEKVTNIQGIVLVNVVNNVRDVQERGASKRLESKISFDDGRTFNDMKVRDKSGVKMLQLHSVTDASNVGSIYSSAAPGILMGVGNTGESLRAYTEGDLFVSDDAGRTWEFALGGPHKYEFGDQGSLLVAVFDGSEIDKISYSTNHGKDFHPVFLEKVDKDLKEPFRVRSLTTHPDSTSLKFIMRATVGAGAEQQNYLYSIDFNKLDMRECKTDDFERWNAVTDEDGKPTCIMGHKQSFRRRKANADCFIEERFKDPLPEYDSEGCMCALRDFECEPQFRRSEDRKKCIPEIPLQPPTDKCNGDEKTFRGTNGFRKIPGNQCTEDEKSPVTGYVEYDCEEATKPINDGEIQATYHDFQAAGFREFYYLERSGSSSDELFGFPDETIVAGTENRQVWITHDHGKKWRQVLEDQDVAAIYPNPMFNDRVYFISPSKEVHYSISRAKTISSFEAPALPITSGQQIMRFHPTKEDWLIWTSCTDPRDPDCLPQSHVTKKNGADWTFMLKAVDGCQFIWREGRKTKEEAIYCGYHVDEDMSHDSRVQLMSSDNFFDDKQVRFDNVVDFATMSEYIIVAAKDEKDDAFLKIDSSIDGVNFADARFPTNLRNSTKTAYTVLDSSTHSIFLHVTANAARGHEYGTIIKSNSNGTSYTLSLRNVNRNEAGYVDFEKISTMEGVAIVNVVANPEAVNQGASKQLQTQITHNDGAQWDYIQPPKKDSEGKSYKCERDPKEKCALHLHSYTERKDPRDTFGSGSAVGFMLGVGNVGESLTEKREADTFMSSDGGITWLEAKKGRYMWEFGDQGGIVVIVADEAPTNVVYYTRDEGRTWDEFKFTDREMPIYDITTVPSDTSMNFLLWGFGREQQAVTINLDFSGLAPRKCNLEDPNSKESDYTLFEPKHPFQENNCLFGHRWQYYRKKTSSKDCHNGPLLDDGALYKMIERNCTCTRQDFECDYNYERDNDGNCKLVPGLSPLSKEEWCKQNPLADTWYSPTGFRRILLTTCLGGKELDISSTSEACPGHEEQYKQKHGISGAGLFFAIVIPIAAAAAIGWWLYRNFEGQFGLGMGRIRLGDSTSGSGGISVRPASNVDWTKYPVMIISGAAAVVMVVPMVLGSVLRRVKEWTPWRRRSYDHQPYTSRGSFSRGRRDYVSVGGQDESDLLGEDSDEDV